jgi:hypothetical protein
MTYRNTIHARANCPFFFITMGYPNTKKNTTRMLEKATDRRAVVCIGPVSYVSLKIVLYYFFTSHFGHHICVRCVGSLEEKRDWIKLASSVKCCARARTAQQQAESDATTKVGAQQTTWA